MGEHFMLLCSSVIAAGFGHGRRRKKEKKMASTTVAAADSEKGKSKFDICSVP
jgi:hypothetical protein